MHFELKVQKFARIVQHIFRNFRELCNVKTKL